MQYGVRVNKFINYIIKLLMIALFAFVSYDVHAASFKYSEFDWDEFSKEKKSYWENYCRNVEDSEDCKSDILKNQEKFYKKLYSLLAKYEDDGYFIDDNIIIETVFFELTPSSFSDDPTEYQTSWETEGSPYVIDEADEDEDETNNADDEAKEYYESEKDTLKILIKNMISYQATCYGVYGNAEKLEASDGTERHVCSNGSVTDIDGEKKCADRLDNYSLGFWEQHLSDGRFLGIPVKSDKLDKCKADESKYPEGSKFVTSDGKVVNLDGYWTFLIDTGYFDKKAHLQHYYTKILDKANVKCMTDDICENSLEDAGLYEEYEEEIKKARTRIVDNIKGILIDYGINIETVKRNDNVASSKEYQRRNYYWPIGSKKIKTKDEIKFADKDPESTEVVSYFGKRKTDDGKEKHYGVDLKGTNVIAAYNGEVITVETDCKEDGICNDGYGIHIIISHPNGDYSVYATLSSVEEGIEVGSKVLRGQLLGKTGVNSNDESDVLHFEIREGTNSVDSAIDPLSILDEKNPRPEFAAGDFSSRVSTLTKEEYATSLRNYCNTHSCSQTMQSKFVNDAENIYDYSIEAAVNPELVIVRAMCEGFSPGSSRNNYWGMGCCNQCGVEACEVYTSMKDGIRGYASSATRYESVLENFTIGHYAYIGSHWFNPGSSSDGGCYYFPYISEYMDPETYSRAESACNGAKCTGSEAACVKTTDADQYAYAMYNVNNCMGKYRSNIFGL